MAMNVLIVAAHPDDEVLGCGGTIARHAADGDAVEVLFLADGVTSRSLRGTTDAGRQRREDAARRRLTLLESGLHAHA